MEHNIEITERPRAKREGKNGGVLLQNWKMQNAWIKCLSVKQTSHSPTVMD